MMLDLLSLSEELLLRIINFVDYPSLSQLALACQTLNRLATPPLYATIALRTASEAEEGVTYLIPLTFLLIQKPHLASFVRNLSIRRVFATDVYLPLNSDDSDNEVDENARRGWPRHPDLDKILKKAVEEVEDSEEEQQKLFDSLMDGGDEGAILTILLPHLNNLRKFDLAYIWIDPEQPLLRLFRKISKREAPFSESSALRNVVDVMVAGYDDKYPNPPDLFGACVELPGIKRLYGYNLGNNEQSELTSSISVLGTKTSSLEEIELRHSKLYPEDLERVLRAPRALKTFIYEVGQGWAWYPLSIPDIIKALALQEGSLENLVLDHPDFLDAQDVDDFSPISVAAFKKLQYVKMSGMFLGGTRDRKECDLTETFPRDLKTLHITYVGESYHCAVIIPALQQVLKQKERFLPELEKLTLEGEFINHTERLDSVKELVQTAKSKGLSTVILASDKRNKYPLGMTSERGWGLAESVQWQGCFNNDVGPFEILDIEGLGGDFDANQW